MGPRIISVCFLFGLIWLVPWFWLRSGGDSIAVTFNGSYPVPVEIDFDDCAPTWSNGQMKQKSGCDSFGSGYGEPAKDCDVTFAFYPIERRVSRLSAKFIMLKDGKEIGRGSVSISSLVLDPEDKKWTQASFRGRCGADELRLTDATALVDGTATDLIASGLIRATGIIPWLPGSEVTIVERDG